MLEQTERISHEVAHGKKIQDEADKVWGWDSKAGRLRATRRANYFIDLGQMNENSVALDLGCGTGLFTDKVYNATKAKITGIDISEELLSQARERQPACEFKIEDAMNMTYPDNHFDVVFGSSILHHLEMDKATKEIFRVLKPGGKMIFAEPNMINPQILVQKNVPFIKRWLGDSPDETAIVRWSFSKMMKDTGFSKVKVFPYDFLHPYTPSPFIPLVKGLGAMVEKIPVLKEIAGSVVIYGEKPGV